MVTDRQSKQLPIFAAPSGRQRETEKEFARCLLRRLAGICVADPVQALKEVEGASSGIDVLIGPEGGFAEDERELLLRQPNILRLALGPRILRADTAGVAALALVQAALGDWAPDRG